MIDDNKIEEAAVKSANYLKGICDFTVINAFEEGFKEGAKWAINEFIKDLWHPANEVPEIGRVIIMENYYPDGRIMFISHMRKSTFHNPIDIGNTKKWFYIDDLFPKEGDEQ